MAREQLPNGGFIDRKRKLVDADTWAESGGTIGIFGRQGYRPVSEGDE